MVCYSNVVFEYGYEYFGCLWWLVIILLIDRCYLILIGVFNFYFNGVFVGLVGIGKIEIVKDFVKVFIKKYLFFIKNIDVLLCNECGVSNICIVNVLFYFCYRMKKNIFL